MPAKRKSSKRAEGGMWCIRHFVPTTGLLILLLVFAVSFVVSLDNWDSLSDRRDGGTPAAESGADGNLAQNASDVQTSSGEVSVSVTILED